MGQPSPYFDRTWADVVPTELHVAPTWTQHGPTWIQHSSNINTAPTWSHDSCWQMQWGPRAPRFAPKRRSRPVASAPRITSNQATQFKISQVMRASCCLVCCFAYCKLTNFGPQQNGLPVPFMPSHAHRLQPKPRLFCSRFRSFMESISSSSAKFITSRWRASAKVSTTTLVQRLDESYINKVDAFLPHKAVQRK